MTGPARGYRARWRGPRWPGCCRHGVPNCADDGRSAPHAPRGRRIRAGPGCAYPRAGRPGPVGRIRQRCRAPWVPDCGCTRGCRVGCSCKSLVRMGSRPQPAPGPDDAQLARLATALRRASSGRGSIQSRTAKRSGMKPQRCRKSVKSCKAVAARSSSAVCRRRCASSP